MYATLKAWRLRTAVAVAPVLFIALSVTTMGTLVFGPARSSSASALAGLILHSPDLQAQAPGWSRGQQNLALGYDECVQRMSVALAAEGYSKDSNSGGNFVAGYKAVHTAVIICSPAPEQKMFVQIVVASNGDGGGSERQRLQAQMDRPGFGNSGGCGLGMRWDESEEGWTGTWTRRGNSNIFDVISSKPGLQSLTAVQTINISGNKVFISRTNASDGNNCDMEGTIDRDGVTVTGTYRCRSGGPYSWRATIRCQ
jgi:hypothetical protein